jgi:hypothetical protein
MKKLVLALTAASALAAAAVPAAAQPYGGGYDRPDRYDRQQRYDNDRAERLMWRIERAERRGTLNSGAASWLRREVSNTERLAWRYSRDGFSQWERQDIDRRYDQLARRVDRDDRRYGYGYGDDYRR